MKWRCAIYSLLFIIFFTSCKVQKVTPVESLTLLEKLRKIPNVVDVKKRMNISHFDENYEIWFKQPVDYNDLSKGYFNQKTYLGFESKEKPVIVELRGYGIGTDKAGELAKHYKANQLTIEHRYFNNSKPELIDWNTLTVKNAAKDQERIISAIKTSLFSKSKFISTGISKGCQTTMAHRRYFPNNVDASVCYVGPLNYQREDPRVYSFLANVGDEKTRKRIKNFQTLCFENRSDLLKILKSQAVNTGMNWEFGVENALDYSILEYSFAFWQWGTNPSSIPTNEASVNDIYTHLFGVTGFGFFEEKSVESLQPYFWAALTEQGIYGYETKDFKKYFPNRDVLKFDWAFPDGITKEYNEKPMQEIKHFIDTKAEDMLFIYGEYDAWSATAVELNNTSSKRRVYKYIHLKGDHKTRISSFIDEQRKEIYSIIDSWIK